MKLHMAARSRFSTSNVIDSEYIVPWPSAEGPLAYSPTKPPARDYFALRLAKLSALDILTARTEEQLAGG
jgi:hypothetical protein